MMLVGTLPYMLNVFIVWPDVLHQRCSRFGGVYTSHAGASCYKGGNANSDVPSRCAGWLHTKTKSPKLTNFVFQPIFFVDTPRRKSPRDATGEAGMDGIR